MRMRQNNNENAGLTYYQQDFQVMGAASAFDLTGWKTDPVFQSIATAMYAKVGKRLNTRDMIPLTVNPSYIPDFIRKYMELAVINDEAFTMKRLDSFWLPMMEKQGYNLTIARALFVAFDELHKDGLVPMRMWKPEPKAAPEVSSEGNGGFTIMGQRLNWWVLGGIGLAVAAVGGFIVMKKR